jgi:phospholipid/cholesterol/gamma-HCH transport system substrate-binding protein
MSDSHRPRPGRGPNGAPTDNDAGAGTPAPENRATTTDEPPSNAPLTTRKSPRIGKSFSSRNPLPIGAIGLVFLLVLLYAAFNASSLPLIGGGTVYSAYFTDSANLKTDDDVRIAGIKVGKVQDVTLDTRKGLVKASFTVKNGWVGDQSQVNIKLETLLGSKYIEIDSQGTEKQDPGKTICDETAQHTCRRTTSPLDVYPAFTKLTDTVEQINTDQLAQSFQTLANDFRGTPEYVRSAVDGLSRLSTTIASRNAQLGQLLSAANKVTGTLADRDQDLAQLLRDGNLLLEELNARRDAIHSLLINTQVLSTQLRGLVADNQQTIKPLLNNLDKVLSLLNNNQETLDRGISLLGPFYRLFNNVVGNGRWFDNYIQDLSPGGILCILNVLPTTSDAC